MSPFIIFALCVSAVYCATEKREVVPVIEIVKQESDALLDGTFHHSYETANGIKVEEEATLKVVDGKDILVRTGSSSHTDKDGNEIVLKYTADENGFHPEGAHLPVPPPTPAAILKALEWIRLHPYKEEEELELAKKTQ